jgi:hypothetical protein
MARPDGAVSRLEAVLGGTVPAGVRALDAEHLEHLAGAVAPEN